MMLLQALRIHLTEDATKRAGLLFALADEHMSAALYAMHAEPARPWTVEELAQTAKMSRSNFALRFKETVGNTPLDYLRRWRMVLAQERLSNSEATISEVATELGYESESAFSTAFKRVLGTSPREFRRIKPG
jgi:AraC-like DNA-binding protein